MRSFLVLVLSGPGLFQSRSGLRLDLQTLDVKDERRPDLDYSPTLSCGGKGEEVTLGFGEQDWSGQEANRERMLFRCENRPKQCYSHVI